jgi:hypothetical protein
MKRLFIFALIASLIVFSFEMTSKGLAKEAVKQYGNGKFLSLTEWRRFYKDFSSEYKLNSKKKMDQKKIDKIFWEYDLDSNNKLTVEEVTNFIQLTFEEL